MADVQDVSLFASSFQKPAVVLAKITSYYRLRIDSGGGICVSQPLDGVHEQAKPVQLSPRKPNIQVVGLYSQSGYLTLIMEPVGPRRVQESKDESGADVRRDSASQIEETGSMEMAGKVTHEEIKISAYQPWILVLSQQEALDDTQLGQDHSASSAQQGPTDTVKKRYRCGVCKKTFTSLSPCSRHRRTHRGENPFKCKCGKTFSRRDNLKRHLRTQSGKRPFKCSTCGKAFSRKDYLKTHIRTHTGEKPHSCSVCGKKFSDSSHCTRHERQHTEGRRFTCCECGKELSNPEDGKRHQEMHIVEEPR